MKLIRTALFSPGNRPERVLKAINSKADAVIIDLEDAVPISEKENTRSVVRSILNKHVVRKPYVRVNGLGTPYCKADLEAVVCDQLNGILFPKVESSEEIFEIDRLLCEAEKRNGLKPGSLEVAILCESAKGLENIYQIVSAKPEYHHISIVAFGAADFTLDLGIRLTREGKELEYARSRLPVACRAAGIMPPLDSPWMIDLKDIDGLIADAQRAKTYGFQGKLVIHPNQIEPCHDVFTPTEEEIREAATIIQAFKEAELEGKAALQLEGRFIDYAFLEKAKRIYALSRQESIKSTAVEDREGIS